MKRIGKLWTDLIRALLLCLVLVLGLTAGGFAAPRKTVLVHNVKEMMEALDDHTEVILAPGRYNLSTWLASTAADQVIHRFPWNPMSPPGLYMAYEDLELAGFQDLTIRGQDTEKITAEIVTEDPYTPVLHFRNCQNFRLAHLRVGHSLQAGRCSGAVLKLDLVQDARLENLDLYGCGTYGYEALGCESVTLRDSVIRSCTYGLINAIECRDMKIIRTLFKDTSTNLPLFAVGQSRLELVDCTFQNVQGRISNMDLAGGTVSRTYEE